MNLLPNPVEVVKRAAVEAVEAQKPVHLLFGQVISINAIENAKPVNLVFGKVSSISPLNINVENKLKLGKEQLLLSKNLSNYSVEIEIEGEKRQIKIYNALESGDEVILLRMQGGQKYLILDRVVK